MVKEFKVSDFKNLKELLNASHEDDISIGLKNIKSIKLDPIYILMLIKISNEYTRERILDEHQDIFLMDKFSHYKNKLDINKRFGSPIEINDICWDNLYNTIKDHYSHDSEIIKIFTEQFTKELTSTITNIMHYKFLDDIKFNIVW